MSSDARLGFKAQVIIINEFSLDSQGAKPKQGEKDNETKTLKTNSFSTTTTATLLQISSGLLLQNGHDLHHCEMFTNLLVPCLDFPFVVKLFT
jgi:hypothetical protein